MEGSSGIEVWFGHALDGDSVLPQGDLAPGAARLGALCRGPGGLLHDLELRLGLVQLASSHGVRVARYGARLAALAPRGRFYTASHDTDPWGTAEELLRWRDLLVESGWTGAALPGAGPRLAEQACGPMRLFQRRRIRRRSAGPEFARLISPGPPPTLPRH